MNKSHPRKIAKEAGITLVGEIFGGSARYLFILLLARFAGAQLLGLYSIANAITRLFGVIGLAGLDRGVMKFVSFNIGLQRKQKAITYIYSALKIGIFTGLGVFILQFISAPFISKYFFYDIPELKFYIQIFSFILPFSIIGGITAFSTQGFQRLKYKVITVQIFQPTILIISVLCLYYFTNDSSYIIKYPIIIAELLGFIMILFFLKKMISINLKNIFLFSFKLDIIKFSLPLMFVGLLGMFMHWIDILMIGFYLSSEDVGIYHPAARTTGVIRMFLLAFSGIFSPMVSEFFAKGKYEELSRIYKLTFRWIFILSLPFLVLCLTRSIKIMNIFGSEFDKGANVLVLLVIGMMFQALGGLAASILVMTERINLALINTILATILNILLNMWLIPDYGILGAAFSTTITLIVLCVIRILQVQKFLNIQPFQIGLWKPFLIFVIAISISTFTQKILFDINFIIDLCVTMGFITIIIIGLFYILKFNEEDKLVLMEIYKKINKNNVKNEL